MEDTKSKVESIAHKYGYYVEDASTVVYKGRTLPTLLLTAVDSDESPEVLFDGNRLGISRFFINHNAMSRGRSLSVKEETEFIRSVNATIQMCKEINELDLDELPRFTTESTVRSRIVDLSDKISRC